MQINPLKKLNINPINKVKGLNPMLILLTLTSIISNNKLAIIIGMLSKNEKSATSLFLTPHISPIAIVEPLRDIPGNIASPCATPTNNACLVFMLISVILL